jgi:hypothetical protein
MVPIAIYGGTLMKKLAALFLTAFILYIVYYDLKIGTLPGSIQASTIKETHDEISYQVWEVKPGDTVLSVVEKLTNESIPVSLSQVVDDFQALNQGVKPEEIQIGKTYKFPVYQNIE